MNRKPTYAELEQRVNELAQIGSKYKQVEFKLKDSERRSRAWLENSPVCTKIVDLDFNLQYMSSAGIKGLQIDDITPYYGKPYPFDFYPESFRNGMTKNLEKVRETSEIIAQEASVFDIEGNELWFHSTIVPVNDEKGRIEYFIIVSVDTTVRKQAETELKSYQDYLEQLVTERTNDLQKVNEELRTENSERKRAEEALLEEKEKLQDALDNIKTLKGLLPICAKCKKIRDDKGYWNRTEKYIESHTDALFTHAVCPECMDKLYGDQPWYNKEDYNK